MVYISSLFISFLMSLEPECSVRIESELLEFLHCSLARREGKSIAPESISSFPLCFLSLSILSQLGTVLLIFSFGVLELCFILSTLSSQAFNCLSHSLPVYLSEERLFPMRLAFYVTSAFFMLGL